MRLPITVAAILVPLLLQGCCIFGGHWYPHIIDGCRPPPEYEKGYAEPPREVERERDVRYSMPPDSGG